MADGLLGAYFGNPNIQRQGARARALAKQRDVNLLADPKTYAVVQGLLGTPPDQLGFSVLNPKYQEIKQVAEPAFYAGSLLQVAPATAPAVNRIAQAVGPRLEQTLLPTFEAAYNRGGLTREMVEAMGTGVQSPITAYHAGPNLFSKFDVKRAPDTGSAYTQGAYAAAARREAEGKYLPRAPQWEEKLMGLYKQAEKNKDYESMEVLESALLYNNPKQLRQDFIESGEYSPEFAKKAEQTIKKIESVPRDSYLYKLDIADEALPNYMLFDKPLSQQPKQVQEYAKELGLAGDEYLGGDIVGKLRAAGVSELQIQETLRKRGIPGLIYDSPDVPGSINYVTYDPDLIKILEINDMPASGLLGQ
jgi:hypothetical protein